MIYATLIWQRNNDNILLRHGGLGFMSPPKASFAGATSQYDRGNVAPLLLPTCYMNNPLFAFFDP